MKDLSFVDEKASKMLTEFGRTQVPLIGICEPKVIELSHTRCIVMLPLTETTKNHLNSMYFGALAVGADLAILIPSATDLASFT